MRAVVSTVGRRGLAAIYSVFQGVMFLNVVDVLLYSYYLP